MAQPLLLLAAALLALALTLSGAEVPLADGEPLEPYDRLFDAAVNSYHRNDWQGVIINMERALKNQQVLYQVKTHCRLQCNNQTGFVSSASSRDFLFDLNFFNTVLRKAECLRACKSTRLGPDSLHQVTEETQLEFKRRTPYNYLQVAYFKIKKLDKAVAAAYTFFVANPEHLEMQQNLEYYKLMAGVKESDFTDLEARPHMESFRAGVRLYTDEQFLASIELFEKALVQYLQADMECRALCEGPYLFDGYSYMEYNADLFQAITDHYIQILSCRQNCAVELASRPGKEKPIDNFLPAHYDHLQFAYYNTENYEKAIECTKTYLLFYPNDEVMNQNQQYYEAVLGDQLARHIDAREVRIQVYINSSLLEKELLYFANEVFGITFIDPDAWTPENVMPVKLREKQKTERETAARISEEIGNLMKEIEHLVDEKTKESVEIVKMVREGGPVLYDGVQVVMNSKMMNGTQRGLMDGVITPNQCLELRMLSNLAASAGDGYRGKPSPHTPNERFQGVTMLKALKLAQDGKVPLSSAKLYYDVSEKVRRILESYYRLEKPLHFSYTHLVCRTAVEGKVERADLSHSIHVDNCILNSEALECRKETPAYTQRDYSAILYFNNDFEGGEFIFTELDAKSITARVKPDCGRLVSFSSGSENPHGVEAVTKGQRCGLAIWFTLDPRQTERRVLKAGREGERNLGEIQRVGSLWIEASDSSKEEVTSEQQNKQRVQEGGVELEQVAQRERNIEVRSRRKYLSNFSCRDEGL
uniref:procollagen-proline 3-dioxygenase n=1 Tax=Callorhinchus milii TaxID=7868 RepID=A0A4W3GM17_CALMI